MTPLPTRHNPIALFPDGNQWCALLGDNLQTGEAEFADTATDAIDKLAKRLGLPDREGLEKLQSTMND